MKRSRSIRSYVSLWIICAIALTFSGCHSSPTPENLKIKGGATGPMGATGPTGATGTTGVTLPPKTFDSASLPIKICCGSMSFYSADAWTPVPGAKDTFCTNLPVHDYSLVLYEMSKPDVLQTIAPLRGTWKFNVLSYHPKPGPLQVGKEGAELASVGNVGCNNESNLIAVRLKTIHATTPPHGNWPRFYEYPGPGSDGWKYSQRFLDDAQYDDYDCAADRDLCERIAAVSINGREVRCKDADCTLFIKKD